MPVFFRRRRRSLAALLLAGLVLAPIAPASFAQGTSLADRVPAEDPALVPGARRAGPPPAVPHAGGAAGGIVADSVILSAAASALGGVAWAVGGLAHLSSNAGQVAHEAAYMVGVNPTKVPRATTLDPYPDHDVRPPTQARTDMLGNLAAPVAATPARTAAATPAAAAGPGPAKPTMPIGPQKEIASGLLDNFVFDRSARKEDGSYFVPKPLQRIFNVRTETARVAEVATTLKIPGRIVPDPAIHGLVQPTVPGRLEAPESGFPVLGETVKAGQILGWVLPSVGVVDRTQVRRDVARLTTDIRVDTEQLEILKQFSFVPFRDGKIYQLEQRIAGLRRERDALLPMLQLREALRAPTDGVVSAMAAVAGKVVQIGETMFDVIDPSKLWVEATAPDPSTAIQASRVLSAKAASPDGYDLNLAYVGSGLSQERQSTPIMFRIDNPPAGLRVGRPVTVSIVSGADVRRGVAISRAAVTNGSSGVDEVWEQVAPETFLPHPVRTVGLDGNSVLVLDGLKDGAKIVVNGARLMAQLQ